MSDTEEGREIDFHISGAGDNKHAICPSEMQMSPSNVHREVDNPIKLSGAPWGESEIIRHLAGGLQRSTVVTSETEF